MDDKNGVLETLKAAMQKAERRKKQEQEQFARFIRNVCDFDYMPRAVWDFEGNFLYVNDKFAEILGYDRRDLMGKPFSDFLHPDDVEKSYDTYEENMEHDRHMISVFENRYIRRDGKVVTMEWQQAWNDPFLKVGSGQIIVKDVE